MAKAPQEMDEQHRGERLHKQENDKDNQPQCELRFDLLVILCIDKKQTEQEYNVSERNYCLEIAEPHRR